MRIEKYAELMGYKKRDEEIVEYDTEGV